MDAAVCSWHEHHVAAIGEIERRLRGRETRMVAAPTLVETYKGKGQIPKRFYTDLEKSRLLEM